MKLSWALFLLCVAMCGIFVSTFFIEEPKAEVVTAAGETVRIEIDAGYAHPDFPTTMSVGGPGAERHQVILWVGYAYGTIIIVFFMCLLAFGLRRGDTLRRLAPTFVVTGFIYLVIFSAMVRAYREYIYREENPLILALPAPTAWMLYGIWGFPVFFIFLYIFVFDRMVWTDADEVRFQQIVARRQKEVS